VDTDLGPRDQRARRQLCALACQDSNGVAYYWSVIDDRAQNAVCFRGFSATFSGAVPAREVMDFTVQGPLIACLSDLQDVTQLQLIHVGGSVGPVGSTDPGSTQVPFDAKILVAPAPQAARDSHNPRGVILRVANEAERTTIATVADLYRHEDWVFAILVAAIAAVAVNSGPALIDVLMYAASIGNVKATITTPIGTVAVNKPFTAVPGVAEVL
jgi:hypothetical protein